MISVAHKMSATTLVYERLRAHQLLISELIASGRDEPSDLVVRLGMSSTRLRPCALLHTTVKSTTRW